MEFLIALFFVFGALPLFEFSSKSTQEIFELAKKDQTLGNLGEKISNNIETIFLQNEKLKTLALSCQMAPPQLKAPIIAAANTLIFLQETLLLKIESLRITHLKFNWRYTRPKRMPPLACGIPGELRFLSEDLAWVGDQNSGVLVQGSAVNPPRWSFSNPRVLALGGGGSLWTN